MRKILLSFIFISFGLLHTGFSQCINGTLYPYGTVSIPSDGSVATISTCNYTTEYSSLSGAVSGETYEFTCTISGTHKYVTITDPSDNVLGHGMSPFSWVSTITGDIRAHWSDDVACNTTSSCHTTTVQNVPPVTGCINGTLYPSGIVPIPSDGSVGTISTCNYTSEYSSLSGAVSGETYEFTCTISGTHKYVTITDPSDNIIGAGMSPYSWVSTVSGDIRAHWSDDVACNTTSSCHTTTVQCTSCGGGAPVNDACGGALPIPSGGMASGATSAATNVEGLTPCQGGGGTGGCPSGGTGTVDFTQGIWYVYTSTGAETITASTANVGTDFDTEIQIWSGACGSLTCIGGDDDGGDGTGHNFDSEICWASTASVAPVDYYIYIDGHGSSAGNVVLTVNTGVLPVVLVSFSGEVMPRSNKLSWKTSSEQNTEMHVIERSANGMNWEIVGETEAAGFTTEERSYEMFDRNPMMKTYYRLKSVDFDGYTEYSKVITIQRDQVSENQVDVYPNPFTEDLSVNMIMDKEASVQIQIFTAEGKLLTSQNFTGVAGSNAFMIQSDQLQSGLYYMTVHYGQESVVQKIVKQ